MATSVRCSGADCPICAVVREAENAFEWACADCGNFSDGTIPCAGCGSKRISTVKVLRQLLGDTWREQIRTQSTLERRAILDALQSSALIEQEK